MLSRTHIINGALCALSFSIVNKYLNTFKIDYIHIISGAVLGSIIPDIDHSKSWITKLLPIKFYKILIHRGLTHSKLFLVVFYLLGYIYNNIFLVGFSIGLFSHLIMDKLYSKTKTKDKKNSYAENPAFYISWILILICIFILNLV